MSEGFLRLDSDGRWEIVFNQEYSVTLSSGSYCEIKIANHWISTTIEHGSNGYYATTQGIQLKKGLKARLQEY